MLSSTRTVVFVGVAAIVLPITFRIVSSPVALFLFSPILLLLLVVAFIATYIYVGYTLDAQRRRKHVRLQQAARPLAFSTPAAWQAVLTRSQWSQSMQQTYPPLLRDSPEVSAAVEDIISKVIRDFVQAWYQGISSSPAFPNSVSAVIHSATESLLDRAAAVDLPALIVRRIIPKITTHIEHFRQSEIALRGEGLERRFTQSEELDLLLAGRYATKGSGKLHPAIENLSTTFTKQTEEMHIRQLMEKALPHILPETAGRSRAVTIVIREILTSTVLYPVMDMISDPDFWNRFIDQTAGAAIHQQKLISKIRNVLEAQSPRAVNRPQVSAPTNAPVTEKITIRTDVRQFESFLRSINRTSSLLDARRLKNDIVGEIRRTRMSLANHEKDDWINGEKTEDVVAFLDRLYTAKRKVEARISVLGGGEDNSKTSGTLQETERQSVSLRDILRNPNSLSYFMEFMDRRNRSLPVQFWLTVESFKNPLESVESDSSGDEEEIIQDPETSVNVKEDISMIHDLYFAGPSIPTALSSIARKHVTSIQTFIKEADPSPASQRKVRRSVLLAQRQIEKDMEQDFEEFERSELWFRAVGDAGYTNQPRESEVFSSSRSLRSDSGSDHRLPQSSTPTRPPKAPLQSRAPVPRNESSQGIHMQRTISTSSKQSLPMQSNIEVLMSPIQDTSPESSRTPLFNDPEDAAQREEQKRMEAIHAALTDIMALEHDQKESPLKGNSPPPFNRANSSSPGPKRRSRVFDDEGPGGEDEGEYAEGEEGDHGREAATFKLAAPGDLQLSYEISRLTDKITNLKAQEEMLDTLIKKAELTGDNKELVLLKKSKSAMNRDLRELEFQKQQYEQQDSANQLISDRTRVSIVGSTVVEEDGKSVVRYNVEIQQLFPDGTFSSGWIIARRYNEFFNMHNKLRERYVLVKNLDFPGKRLVANLSGSFLDTRKVALEKYLQALIAIPIVCESAELKAFLSRDSPGGTPPNEAITASKSSTAFSGTDLVRNVYRSVAESIDDMFFGPSMLDVTIQRLTRQAAEFAGIVGSGVHDEELVAQALNASGRSTPDTALLQLSGELAPLEGESGTSTFLSPICDLVLAVFELNKQNNWLRRQAIVIILQQLLGGTIERKVRDTIKDMLSDTRVMRYIDILRDSLWPNGKLRGATVPRTAEEKIRTRDEANRKLSALVPDLAANMIGRSNARRGARRIFAVLQNRRLNQHIAYMIIDELFAAMFPESIAVST